MPNKHNIPAELLPMTTCADLVDLADLADKINIRVKDAEARATSAMEYALEAGALLTEAKLLVPHGQWNDWLTTNCVVAPRTAQAYMRLAKTLPLLSESKAQRVADLPVREAVKAIATNPTAPPQTRREAIRISKRDDVDRVVSTLRNSSAALRDAAKRINIIHELKGSQITALRDKLTAAIEALDKLGDAHEL